MKVQNKQDFPTMQEYLNYRFIYKDGELYWRTHIKHNTIIGQKVSVVLIKNRKRKDSRVVKYIRVDEKNKIMSRVIWKMHHGDIPNKMVVDHKNKDHLDNRIENLRLLTNQQNLLNTDKILQAHNTSGYRGVHEKNPDRPKPWVATINFNNKRSSKSFETAKEAALWRDKYIDKYNLPLVKNLS